MIWQGFCSGVGTSLPLPLGTEIVYVGSEALRLELYICFGFECTLIWVYWCGPDLENLHRRLEELGELGLSSVASVVLCTHLVWTARQNFIAHCISDSVKDAVKVTQCLEQNIQTLCSVPNLCSNIVLTNASITSRIQTARRVFVSVEVVRTASRMASTARRRKRWQLR